MKRVSAVVCFLVGGACFAQGVAKPDALGKQPGLKLTLETAPRPALAIDHGDDLSTPNPPNLAALLPPLPPAQFDVATLKPSRPDAPQNGRVDKGQVQLPATTMKGPETGACGWKPNGPRPIRKCLIPSQL